MQKAPPRLPSRCSASIQLLSKARLAKAARSGENFPKFVDDEIARFFEGIDLVVLPSGAKISHQASFSLPSLLGLGLEILAEHGEGILHGGQHGFEGLAVHARRVQRRVDRILAPALFVQACSLRP